MRHFVTLSLSDGRDVAWPVDLIAEVVEPTPEESRCDAAQGCVYVTMLLEMGRERVVGTVASVLAKIADAQRPAP